MANSGRPLLAVERKCNRKIILYVTESEKRAYQRRAKEKGNSVSDYIRQNLTPLTRKLKEMYAAKEEETKG